MQPPEPRLELISHATVAVAPPDVGGRTPLGERRAVRIISGRFEGRLSGDVMPGGTDYQIIAPDGTAYLDAKYMIRTSNGALIFVRNRGIRHGVIGNDPSQYYFRSSAQFETSDADHLWLNRIVTVCSGARTPDSVILDVYQVL